MKKQVINKETIAIIRLTLAVMVGVQKNVTNFANQFRQANISGTMMANIELVEVEIGEVENTLVYDDFPPAMQAILNESLQVNYPDLVFEQPMLFISQACDEEGNDVTGCYSMNLMAMVSSKVHIEQKTNEK